MDFKIYQHIIIRFKLWLGGSWLDLWKSCLRSVSLFPLYLYSNVKLALLSIATPLYRVAHSSSSSVCPAILQMTLLPNKLSFLPLPSVPSVTFPPSLPSPHTAPASLPLSVPSPNVTTLPPPPSTSILPLVSLMNGFTAGKVLIFIPLSDFCWLLLISNTQRKASESINKEMNTLHPAI